jgi:hypothetical protein
MPKRYACFRVIFVSPTFLLGGQHTYHRRIAAIGMLSLLSCFVSPLTKGSLPRRLALACVDDDRRSWRVSRDHLLDTAIAKDDEGGHQA